VATVGGADEKGVMSRARTERHRADPIKASQRSPATAAEYLGVSRSTVYRLIHARQIRAIKVGSVLKLRPSDIDSNLSGNVVS